ncbi:MAG: DUF2382 domain-containing protein [Coleofasciculus sp. C1-SOL-03]|jgi:uncharacterized protein (TIGR02271 family)|uniref:DUF2382 domain-containing protein n=1 Tax=Coleofasciculus sp. C1-SOL-03 TaxID=3069522 RepID=UPI0032F3A603
MIQEEPKGSYTKEKIQQLLDQFRERFTFFTIVNQKGKVLGRVEDFCVAKNHRLYMVMSTQGANSDSPWFLLSRQHIQTIEPENRAVIVDLSPAELEYLPVYQKNDVTSTSAGDSEKPIEVEQRVNPDLDQSDQTSEIVEEDMIRLLEEQLVVNRSKQKVGEVVVRKEIETRMVEVPVRREKLIVEQVGADSKPLAEIDLGKGKVTGVSDSVETSPQTTTTVKGEFVSPKAASDLLAAIALQDNHGCANVRVELVVDNPELQEMYQKMFDRCRGSR